MYLLGMDIGGTSVRAVVTDEAGTLVGRGRSGGANFRSSDGDPVSHLDDALGQALGSAGLDGSQVHAAAVGAAGAAQGGRATVSAMLEETFRPRGIPTPVLVDDTDIAFRSAAPASDGVLLLAGTGSGAARYSRWRQVARCDGMGWLLGDEGSGVWLGREVLRAAAADLDRRGPATALTGEVLRKLGVPDAGDPRQPLIAAAASLPAAAWGRFAAPALELDGRDAVADALLDEAAARLTAIAEAVSAKDEVVFAGGLLAAGPLRARLLRRFTGPYAAHPVVGACALAADSAGAPLDRAALLAALDRKDAERGGAGG
ncbi:BadF/BadG/BcrA/BcrD ATPase family protein [Brooklawnia cerclae]|uniref:N-acetylglucosamine kinase-like BadF-type ATPase n=1 Tax=Brooklawnia cerclae TaxID=349934 RepID=A0ABX0SK91_9ACTN|nr:BadF/BadG/BcrA/BcrD ATPase family protein [Brooklawnia cerclae]NIH58349.1 N-acetylglucosamine kinase-like BadF-type ATPase [Brooklawnia cerclae]